MTKFDKQDQDKVLIEVLEQMKNEYKLNDILLESIKKDKLLLERIVETAMENTVKGEE